MALRISVALRISNLFHRNPNLEKSTSVDQTGLARVQTLIDASKHLFYRQGAVVVTWRTVASQRGSVPEVGPLDAYLKPYR